MRKTLILFAILIPLFGVVSPTKAEEASLYLSPDKGTFYVGSTFNISVFVNTGNQDINIVKLNLKFSSDVLQLTSPAVGSSFVEMWISQPTYSNIEGTISMSGGLPHPGINTSAGLFTTLVFRARVPGTARIEILESSQVLRSDGKGTNILTSFGQGEYTILLPPPKGPRIYSSTHSDQNKWYRDNYPIFVWQKEEGAKGFSWSFDNDPEGIPDGVIDGTETSIGFSDISSGFLYFHLRAINKDGLPGGVSHYLVRIDTTPPAEFTPKISPSGKSLETRRVLSFFTTDRHSKIDRYNIKIVDLSKTKEETLFIEQTSAYHLPELPPGKYRAIVRAYDKAGNWRDGEKEFEIIPPFYRAITKEGIFIKGYLIKWWWMILGLALVLLISGRFIRSWWEKYTDLSDRLQRQVRKARERLRRERKELAEQIQEEKEVKEVLEKGLEKLGEEKTKQKPDIEKKDIEKKDIEKK